MKSVILKQHNLEVHITNFMYTSDGQKQLSIYPGLGEEFAKTLLGFVPDDVYAFARLGEIDPHLIKRTYEFEYWLGHIESVAGRNLTLYRSWNI